MTVLERMMIHVMTLFTEPKDRDRPTMSAVLATLNWLWEADDWMEALPGGAPVLGQTGEIEGRRGIDVYWGNGGIPGQRALILHVPGVPYPAGEAIVQYADYGSRDYLTIVISDPAQLAHWLEWRQVPYLQGVT